MYVSQNRERLVILFDKGYEEWRWSSAFYPVDMAAELAAERALDLEAARADIGARPGMAVGIDEGDIEDVGAVGIDAGDVENMGWALLAATPLPNRKTASPGHRYKRACHVHVQFY